MVNTPKWGERERVLRWNWNGASPRSLDMAKTGSMTSKRSSAGLISFALMAIFERVQVGTEGFDGGVGVILVDLVNVLVGLLFY